MERRRPSLRPDLDLNAALEEGLPAEASMPEPRGHALQAASLASEATHEETVSESEALRVWHVAARLQAEAARRLDARSQQIAQESGPTGALVSPAQFSRDEVDHIAEAAGIDPAFVALAWREVEAERFRPDAGSDRLHRRAAAFLGTEAERLSVTHTFDGSPQAVYEAMQQVLPASPYRLRLAEIIGDVGAPADASLLFDVPQIGAQVAETGGYTSFAYAMSAARLTRVVLTLHALGNGRTEATATVDLRHGKIRTLTAGSWWAGMMGAALAFAGGVAGLAIGDGGAGIAIGATLGATGASGVAFIGHRAGYASGLRKGQQALSEMLRDVDLNLRAGGAFAPTEAPKTRRPSSNDGEVMLMLTTL